ncbi:hypothetical protein ABZ907_43945 [Nonomuraea wenchangensis]
MLEKVVALLIGQLLELLLQADSPALLRPGRQEVVDQLDRVGPGVVILDDTAYTTQHVDHPGPPRWFCRRPLLGLPQRNRLLISLDGAPGRHLHRPAVAMQQLAHPLDGVADVEQPSD